MRQAEVYAQEFGYLPVFERYVASGLAPFLDYYDDTRDRLWVAERPARAAGQAPGAHDVAAEHDAAGRAGARVGCIAIHHDAERPGWAKLRWFLVEAHARGSGVGARLLDTAVAFARAAGYDGIHLATCADLHAARRQYERAGFTLAWQDAAPCLWAPWTREQVWEMRLR
jgi:GNAT superfamily N-acetyltransferase